MSDISVANNPDANSSHRLIGLENYNLPSTSNKLFIKDKIWIIAYHFVHKTLYGKKRDY